MDKKLLDKLNYDSCIAIIPARGGSKSVPKKNIREFKGHPLIAYSIGAASMANGIDRIIVSTDSPEIAEIAKKYGAEVPFIRPSEYARDDSPDIEFVQHMIGWLAENENSIPEYLVHLRPTSPIRNYEIIDDAIAMIKQDNRATSLRSGSRCIHPPFKWFQVGANGYFEPLMPGLTNDEVNNPRQEFPDVYIPNGYVDILKSDFIISSGLMHGRNMIGYRTEEIPDIDTELDIKKLEIYPELKNVLEKIIDYLNNIVGRK